jgi:hypothetical protein
LRRIAQEGLAQMNYGPVDILLLAMGEPQFDGSILTELERLAAADVIRVLDAMVLMVDDEGNRLGLDIEELPPEQSAALGFIDTGTQGLFDSTDADLVFEGMVPGSAVVALAIENRWTVPLMNSFLEAGAEIALHTRIPAPIVEDALASLAGEE